MSMSDYDTFNPAPGFLGIDPDYANKIPEPSTFTLEALIKKLNTESYPWDKESFSAHLDIDWVWQTDVMLPTGVLVTLQKNKEVIGHLNLTDPWADFVADGFVPFYNCTVSNIRFIRECTGWTITI